MPDFDLYCHSTVLIVSAPKQPDFHLDRWWGKQCTRIACYGLPAGA